MVTISKSCQVDNQHFLYVFLLCHESFIHKMYILIIQLIKASSVSHDILHEPLLI